MVGTRAFFFGEISLDVSKSDELVVVPPKYGQCNKASKGGHWSKKKSPGWDHNWASQTLEWLTCKVSLGVLTNLLQNSTC